MTQRRIVIAGGGRVGRRAANLLDDRGHDVVVIEDDPEQVALLEEEHVATVISGDATRPSILRQAGLDRSDALAALTQETGTNLAICMAARHIQPNLRTIMRTEYDVGDEYDEMVDEVIFTEAAGARAAVNLIERDVQTLESMAGDLDILQIRVCLPAGADPHRLGRLGIADQDAAPPQIGQGAEGFQGFESQKDACLSGRDLGAHIAAEEQGGLHNPSPLGHAMDFAGTDLYSLIQGQ